VSVGVGVVLGVRGIVGKELRSRTRGYWRPMLQLTVYLGLVLVAVIAVLGVSLSATGTLSPTLGDTLFSALATGSVLLIAFMAPGLTAASISGERERLTLDLLLVTRASPLGLVAGKLAGALLWIVYLLLASLPALAVVNLFGGVPLLKAVAALTVIGATALAYSALGLALSALLRRTVLATVLAYALVLLTVIIVPIVATSLAAVSAFSAGLPNTPLRGNGVLGLPPASAWLAFISPLSAMISVLGGTFGPSFGGSGRISVLSTYVSRIANAGQVSEVTSLAPWVFYAVICIVFAVVCVLLAALALQPVPVWRRISRER
jgi:ABC-type transport system involved in multi-copper enzyme maturation permease subunit